MSAKDKSTGKEQDITITNSSGLSDTDIEQMIEDAKSNEEADKAKKQEVETINKLNTLVYQAEKLISSNSDGLSEQTRQAVESAVNIASAALDSEDASSCTSALSALEEALHAASKEAYGSQAHPSMDQDPPEAEDDDIIDAEYA